MKRDMDLVRKILMDIEAESSGRAPREFRIEGYADEQVGYHVYIMIEAGLLDGCDVTSMDSRSPVGMAIAMTWQGHDFLDACRDDSRWSKAKGIVKTIGGATTEVFKQVLTKIMLDQVNAAMS